VIAIEYLIVAMIFIGAAAAMVRAVLLRREAVSAWRAAVGGKFDARQRRFVTDLDLDRARLPPAALRKLTESRRALIAGALVGLIGALAMYWVTIAHA
jgi:hypothetical protein